MENLGRSLVLSVTCKFSLNMMSRRSRFLFYDYLIRFKSSIYHHSKDNLGSLDRIFYKCILEDIPVLVDNEAVNFVENHFSQNPYFLIS